MLLGFYTPVTRLVRRRMYLDLQLLLGSALQPVDLNPCPPVRRAGNLRPEVFDPLVLLRDGALQRLGLRSRCLRLLSRRLCGCFCCGRRRRGTGSAPSVAATSRRLDASTCKRQSVAAASCCSSTVKAADLLWSEAPPIADPSAALGMPLRGSLLTKWAALAVAIRLVGVCWDWWQGCC